MAFNPYAKCSDKPVLPSDLIFEPVSVDLPLAEFDELAATPKLEEIFRHLVAAALETADDVGVLGAKRKARRAADAAPRAPAAPANAPAKPMTRQTKSKKRRRVQKMSSADSEDDSYDDDDDDESDYEP